MTLKTDLWLEESPIDWIEGEKKTYSITWTGKVAGSNASVAIYRNNQDVSDEEYDLLARNMDGSLQGDISNGTPPVQTLPEIRNLVGGEEYVLVISATVDGQTEKHKCLIRCVKPGATQ